MFVTQTSLNKHDHGLLYLSGDAEKYDLLLMVTRSFSTIAGSLPYNITHFEHWELSWTSETKVLGWISSFEGNNIWLHRAQWNTQSLQCKSHFGWLEPITQYHQGGDPSFPDSFIQHNKPRHKEDPLWPSHVQLCDGSPPSFNVTNKTLTCRGEPSTWQVEEGGGGSRWWPSSSRGPGWCPRTSALQWAAAYPGRQSNTVTSWSHFLLNANKKQQTAAVSPTMLTSLSSSVPKVSFLTATKSYDCLSSLSHSFPATQSIKSKFILHHIQRARVEGSGSIYHMWCTGHMFLSEEWHLRSQVLLWFWFLLFCWCPGLPRDRKHESGSSRADGHWGQTTLWAYLVCFQQAAFFIFWKDSRVWGPIWGYIPNHRKKMMTSCAYLPYLPLLHLHHPHHHSMLQTWHSYSYPRRIQIKSTDM